MVQNSVCSQNGMQYPVSALTHLLPGGNWCSSLLNAEINKYAHITSSFLVFLWSLKYSFISLYMHVSVGGYVPEYRSP